MEFDYHVLWSQKISLLSYVLLMLSIISIWIKRTPLLWGSLLVVAVIAGLAAGRLNGVALGTIILYGSIVYTFFYTKNKILKAIFGVLAFTLSMLLWFHKLPGFQNWQITHELLLSPNAYPLNLYLNFDKSLIALFLLGFGKLPLMNTIKIDIKFLFGTLLACALVGAIAVSINLIQWDLKFGNFFWVWAFNNLIFICVAEEMLFRGFLQEELSRVFSRYRYGSIMALGIAAIGFGLSHLGPLPYMSLTIVCGFFYGFIYLKTKKIELAILGHFLLNAIHIIGFSYPLLKI